ncbi:MAG: YdeI/OmpD-associated family protein, partial [Actinomycetales bacterium]
EHRGQVFRTSVSVYRGQWITVVNLQMRDAGLLTATFDSLAYTHRKEHVRVIEDAKKPDTRARRIEAAISKLKEQ